MLTLFTGREARDCQGISRREFLRVGALGLGGLTLPWLSGNSARASGTASYLKDKSVVFLFLSGGASQIETFDPKMNAPAEFRSVTGEVQTSIPGITFGGTFPQLAQRAHRLTVIRSFTCKDNRDETHESAIRSMLKGGSQNPVGASLGAITARLRGSVHPRSAVPTFIQLADPAEGGEYEEARVRYYDGNAPGTLGPAYGPFDPSREGELRRNMALKLPIDRLADRRALLESMDQLSRQLDLNQRIEGTDACQRQAFDVILGKCGDAFDLTKENRKTLERYDTSQVIVGFGGSSRGKSYQDHASPLGKQLLLARRLCEAGCGLVTINSPAWDSHGDGIHPNVAYTMEHEGRAVDLAVSAFLDDVAERGLSEKILLVISCEFGRTPKVEPKGGRGHWGKLCPLVLAGGGWKMGQVIGRSTARAESPDLDPVAPKHLMATIMQTLFDRAELRVANHAPRDLVQLIEEAEPIPRLE